MIRIHPFTKSLFAVCCAATFTSSWVRSQTFDIKTFDTTAQGPWSDVTNTTLRVPKVPNGSIRLNADPSSAEYGGFKGVTVTPGINGWILDYPDDRAWDGPADSSFTYWLAHDDYYFYVGVDAKDDIVNSDDSNDSFWKDDAIEILVDAINDHLDTNTDTSNDKYGGHCYVNYLGRFSRWDDSVDARNGDQNWATGVDWKYGPNNEIYGFGTNVSGGWKMEVRFRKSLFEDPAVTNKLDNGYVMGFNIGLDDDDKHGPGLNGDASRTQDLEIQYFWANRQRRIGLTADKWAALTSEQQKDQTYLDPNFPMGIDSNGRLTHGGAGQINFAPTTPSNPPKFSPVNLNAGKVTLSWTGSATLQSSTSLPAGWADVSPAPAGNSYSVTPSGQTRTFFRLRQSGAGATTSDCITSSPDSVWVNSIMPNQTGTFSVQFEATPSEASIDAVMALSSGPGAAFNDFACLARFYEGDNTIDARNGDGYAADNVIPYLPNVTYKFRMAVDIPAHTYSVYVTPAGGTELTVGTDFAFRTQQNTVTNLNNWGIIVDSTSGTGTNTVCNFRIP